MGRRSLFVNPGFTVRIKGLTTKEGDTQLCCLYDDMAMPEYVVCYRWEAGDIGFWDNRTTMHYAIGDYWEAHRVIQRVTIKSDRPFWAVNATPPRSVRSERRAISTKDEHASAIDQGGRAWRRCLAVLIATVATLGSMVVATSVARASAATKSSVSLSGATLNFDEQLKEYQTIFNATGALQGAPYTVNWSESVGGPPIIAAETDLGASLGKALEPLDAWAKSWSARTPHRSPS
jgi:hypothetical protein